MRRTGRKRQEVRHQSSRLQRLLHMAISHTGLVTEDRNLFVAQTLEIGDCEQLDPDQSVITGSLQLPGGLGASGGLHHGQNHGQGQPTRCPPGHVLQPYCPARPAGPPQGQSRSRPVPPPAADTIPESSSKGQTLPQSISLRIEYQAPGQAGGDPVWPDSLLCHRSLGLAQGPACEDCNLIQKHVCMRTQIRCIDPPLR